MAAHSENLDEISHYTWEERVRYTLSFSYYVKRPIIQKTKQGFRKSGLIWIQLL